MTTESASACYRAIYGSSALSRYALQPVPPIHIIVRNGQVTLEGVAANEMDKNIANIQAHSVPGVSFHRAEHRRREAVTADRLTKQTRG